MNKIFLVILIFTVFFGYNNSVCQSTKNLKKQVVRLGTLPNIVDGVYIKDAEAAFKIITDSFIKRLRIKNEYNFDFEGKMYADLKLLKADIDNKSIHFFNLSLIDYLSFSDKKNFVPILTGTNLPNENFDNYLLVTNSTNPINELKELKKASISIPKELEQTIGTYWLKSMLREQLGKKVYSTLSFLITKQSDSELMLSVFFNKTDYVLVSKSSFELGCELNPSLKSKIKVLDSSGPLVSAVFLYRVGTDPTTIKSLIDVAVDMYKDVEGKQILNLFKIQRIVPITEKDISESVEIINKYNRYFK